MGFSSGTLAHYIKLGKSGKIKPGARVLEFGSQNIHGDVAATELRKFADTFGAAATTDQLVQAIANGAKVEHLMRLAGFAYTAFDVFEDGATRIFDLNADSLSAADHEQFDVVTNCGTSEHVCNQYNVFRVAHDALKIGGVMLNYVPFFGQVDHGFFNYHPKFFTTLIRANAYEPLFFGLSDIYNGGEPIDGYRGVISAENGKAWEGKYTGCAQMCIAWQKTASAKFLPPIDTGDFPLSIDELCHYKPSLISRIARRFV